MSDTSPAPTAEAGLTTLEARHRLRQAGPNRVAEQGETPLWRLALAQFRSLVVLLLLAAAGIAWALGERAESVAILAALLLNATIGFVSEWRARVSLARLRALAVPQAMVRRDGYVTRIAAAELVPGDVLILDAGAAVPADARLLRAAALQVNESTLTGESSAVWKDAAARSGPETQPPPRARRGARAAARSCRAPAHRRSLAPQGACRRGAQRGLTRNRARRFRAQHASLGSVQAGRSLPYEIATIRSAGMPCAIR